MQTENSGSSQNNKQEDIKRVNDSERKVGPETGGNEYTAAFILYCQKTLDNFRQVYASDAEAGLGSSSELGLGSSSSSSSGLGSSSSSGLGSEPENDEFELEQDYQSQSNGDEEKEALREFSEQFEQMLKARTEFEDNDLELREDDETLSDDYKEKEALRELSEQFEQMLKAKADFEDNDLELDEDNKVQPDDHKEKEALEEFFEQFEQMFDSKKELEDNDLELREDDEARSGDYEEKEELEEFFEQFEQMLKTEAESGNNSLELEQGSKSQPKGYKGKEALKELLGQFEQMLNTDADPENEEFELKQYDRSQSNGHKEEELKELFEQPGQVQRTARGAGALYQAKDGSDSHAEEKALQNVTEASTPSSNSGMNDVEVDEALAGVGEVVKSAKENLGIVEAFWEESEAERATLLAKAQITQDEFEQIVTRAGSHLYDVKDCLEGWGDLSMLPETYEQLLLANNELTELFEKMYGKRTAEVLDKKKEPAHEEEDDWELDDDDDDDDDWELDDDDDDDDDWEEDTDL
jgi:hypothetical protein